MTTEEFKKLTQNNKPLFIDFYADWCEPCKMLDTILEEIKPKLNGKVLIEKIDLLFCVSFLNSCVVISHKILFATKTQRHKVQRDFFVALRLCGNIKSN